MPQQIEFGPWTPDQPAFGNRGVVDAQGVERIASGYAPLLGSTVRSTAALPEGAALGLWIGAEQQNNIMVMAATNTKLLGLHGDGTWQDMSKDGGYLEAPNVQFLRQRIQGTTTHYGSPARGRWRAIEVNGQVIATDGINPVQAYTVGAEWKFADLDPSTPRGFFIAQIRDFTMLGDTTDQYDGHVPNRMWWSGLARPTQWGSSAATESDFQDFADTGALQGLVGGTFGTVLGEENIYMATFVGPPAIFQFDRVIGAPGCYAAGSIVDVRGDAYYWAREGVAAIRSGQVARLGADKVNRWLFNTLRDDWREYTQGHFSPDQNAVHWLFCSSNAVEGVPDYALIYWIAQNEFTYVRRTVETLGDYITSALTLADVTAALNTLATSFEDVPLSVVRTFGGIQGGHLVSFDGAPVQGTIETRDVQLNTGRVGGRAKINRIMPLIEAPRSTLAFQIGSRATQGDAIAWSGTKVFQPRGSVFGMKEGRFHRVRVVTSGPWTTAQGVLVDGIGTGNR